MGVCVCLGLVFYSVNRIIYIFNNIPIHPPIRTYSSERVSDGEEEDTATGKGVEEIQL